MAKLISAVVTLFLLFAFSHARTPVDIPDGLDGISASTLRLLRLPSERQDPENVAETEPRGEEESEEEKVVEAEFATIMSHEENTADGSMSKTMPLTVFSFESHRRQFPRGRTFPMGLRHRGGHGHDHGIPLNCGDHPENDEMENDNVRDATPHGGDNNDEMSSSSSSDDNDNEPFKMARFYRGGSGARWTNFRHVGPRFPYEHNDVLDSEMPHRHHHHYRHRHHGESELQDEAEVHHDEHEHEHEHEHMHEHEHEQEHEHEHDHEEEHEHGLFRGIRKFLIGF